MGLVLHGVISVIQQNVFHSISTSFKMKALVHLRVKNFLCSVLIFNNTILNNLNSVSLGAAHMVKDEV